jgi:membrane associated rhomboid family serine protease
MAAGLYLLCGKPNLSRLADPLTVLLRRVPLVLWAVALACCLPELICQGADLGLFGSARWRPLAYQNAGFWTGLLQDWRPNYAAQPVTMFVTYAFLHAGFMHLLGNILALCLAGPMVIERFAARGFLIIFGLSVLGGGLGFGLLASSTGPMVGASGAVSGLFGALIVHKFLHRAVPGRFRLMAVQIGGLIALNAVTWWLQDGLLAWQAHLGGGLAGMASGYVLFVRNRR